MVLTATTTPNVMSNPYTLVFHRSPQGLPRPSMLGPTASLFLATRVGIFKFLSASIARTSGQCNVTDPIYEVFTFSSASQEPFPQPQGQCLPACIIQLTLVLVLANTRCFSERCRSVNMQNVMRTMIKGFSRVRLSTS